MPEDTEKLSAVPESAAGLDEARPAAVSGITLPAVLTGAGLLLLLAWGLPYWSLGKRLTLGMGGYLPLEAFALTLALLVFNRFRGVWLLAAGFGLCALVMPWWHAAAYAQASPDLNPVDVLSGPAGWLYQHAQPLIEAPDQEPGWRPRLVAAGALLVFGAGAGGAWLVSLLLPAIRRRFNWREIAVIFVLLAVGTFSC